MILSLLLFNIGAALSAPYAYSYSWTPYQAFQIYQPYQTYRLPTSSYKPFAFTAPQPLQPLATPALKPLQTRVAPLTPFKATAAKLRALSTPSGVAALAYLKTVGAMDICARGAEVYLETLQGGGTAEDAVAAATTRYQTDIADGLVVEPGSACEASDVAWRAAAAAGTDPLVASAKAFMAAWPGTKAGNPCAVSGTEYVNSILAGSTHLAANLAAAKVFAAAIQALAASGQELKDPACAVAAGAYLEATTNKPSPPNAAAAVAFIEKAFKGTSIEYDPVCWKSTEAFITAYTAGSDELAANLAAAEAFLGEFSAGGAGIPADSPCAAATVAYLQATPNAPSPANKAAMEAFLAKMIGGGSRQPDPVCAAATKAYWLSYKSGADELTSNFAAAQAFLAEYKQSGATVPADSPCVAATRVYAEQIRNKPSPLNSVAMLAFIDEAILTDMSKADPVCLASAEAFFTAWAAGATEEKANEEAGVAFLDAVAANPGFSPGSPCGLAAQAYMAAAGAGKTRRG